MSPRTAPDRPGSLYAPVERDAVRIGTLWVDRTPVTNRRYAAFVAASAIVVEATLSFLNIGPGLASVSWGSILLQGRTYAYAGAWHLWFFPGLALVSTVMCLHSLADRKERR